MVAAQWTWDAYGNVISAEHLRPHAVLAVGHKGLLADRLDAGVAEAATPGQTISPTGPPTGPPRLAPWARVQWHNRNRTYDPSLGRFVQGDPNAAGQTLLASRHHGLPAIASVDGVELASRFGDGPGLQTYLGSSPWTSRDEMGLSWVEDYEGVVLPIVQAVSSTLPVDMVGPLQELLDGYNLMREVHGFLQEAAFDAEGDVDWASNWNLPDDWSPRMSSQGGPWGMGVPAEDAEPSMFAGATSPDLVLSVGPRLRRSILKNTWVARVRAGRSAERWYQMRHPNAKRVTRMTKDINYTTGRGAKRSGRRLYDFSTGTGRREMMVDVKSVKGSWGSELSHRVKTQVYKDAAMVRKGGSIQWVFVVGKRGRLPESVKEFIRGHGIEVAEKFR